MRLDRRSFLGTAAASVLAAGTMTRGRVFGANDRVRVATAGLRQRGWAHLQAIINRPDVEVVALCDVDAKVLEGRAAEVKKATGVAPRTYRDIRDLVADEGVDAITLGTPNHWHVLGAIWAMEAGKDVYVEKPISHTVWEGRQLIAAAKKYGRVIQHGTQRRSSPHWQRAIERAKSGIIGDIYKVRCPIFKERPAVNGPMSEEPWEWLDWPLWQGPARDKPFSTNYVHYNWHWFWHYGNGEVGNNGPHLTDLTNWLFDKGLPVKTFSTGGNYGYEKDCRDTPNTQLVSHTFADGAVMEIESRARFTNNEAGVTVGNLFYGSGGHMADGRFYDAAGKEIPDEKPPARVGETAAHLGHFIEAVKKADPAAVPATVEQGHVAAALCHLGNIAYRVGRGLEFDPKTERFVSDDDANALLTRPYREGFAVPQLA
ncbi:MAG: Gfo/Idh/MocA family oxidoreductase [bacterium]|nr:Gfo/Idh/MocA family oxidoreductase [bacterium]